MLGGQLSELYLSEIRGRVGEVSLIDDCCQPCPTESAFGICSLNLYNALKMIRNHILLAFLAAALVTCIDQTCSNTNNCPTNAECEDNGYCICQQGFIGSCNTPALQVTSSPISASLTSNSLALFYTVPTQLGNYIQFTYTICQNNSQLNITISMWGETGDNTQYNSGNTLTSSSQISIGSGCSNINTPYIEFGSQPNGQSEMLILGITDNSAFSTTITISVSQDVVVVFLIYYYILIALGGFIALFLIIGGVIFIFRRLRLRALMGMAAAGRGVAEVPDVNDISYFETEMPILKAFTLGNDRNVCPICLMQLERNDLIRKTPCAHTFHSSCIDSWCLKTLTCPVCRADLSREKINQKKDEPVQPQYHPVVEQQAEQQLDERPGEEKVVVDDKYDIRESML